MKLSTVDWENPPLDPPEDVPQPLLWRLAARLLHDHVPGAGFRPPVHRCNACDQVWPCSARGYAERGLLVSCRVPVGGRGAAVVAADWLLDGEEWWFPGGPAAQTAATDGAGEHDHE
ncbi:hypothetical protein CS0771_73950 [Catellatospora sp. IY07-71]|uniref:hypothetical protein n=1 Tax=Catellatospora sp. IY07-71 TaxID=2728827 RepID=UPI001BB3726D|nr:hypothetical protein [Catellatospora sp. IY07-71]BCJ77851.1 hypothetical protein CS0771_73950 [Catellatospora sp. IY07-71]